MTRWQRGLAVCAGLALTVGLALNPAVAAETATPTEAEAEAVVAASDDVRALVAPVALYPDPILALVLQSSTLPLQVVQANRFLDKRSKNSSLQPDPDWDKSIIGLLNYPRQVQSMAEYVDWTEELGNAVVDNLDDVQSSVQDIRLASYYAGFLKSDDRQKVEVKDGIVRITSTDPKKVSIPQYDPAALLTALDDVDEVEDAADEEAAVAPAAATTPTAQKSAPTAAPAASPPAAPAPGTAPSDVAAPAAYPVTPPAIAYGEPENSFWQSAATFGGGAVVGGLLGWGLTEAFDDDDNGGNDGNWDNDQVQDALRERREFRGERRDDFLEARDERRDDRKEARQDVVEARSDRREEIKETREDRAARAREQLNAPSAARGGKAGPAAGGAPKASGQLKRAPEKRDVKLPGAGTQAGVTEKVRQRSPGPQQAKAAGKPAAAKLTSAKQPAAKSGVSQKRGGKGMAASTGGFQQVRQEADRGARSRVAQGGGQKRSIPASVGKSGGGRRRHRVRPLARRRCQVRRRSRPGEPRRRRIKGRHG